MSRMRHHPNNWLACRPAALALLALFALVASAQAQAPRLLDAPLLDALRTEVRTNHPTVAAAQARVLAAEAGVRAVRLCWKIGATLMGVIGVCFIFGRDELIELMAPKSPMLWPIASPLVLICAAAQPFFATCIILKTSMRGAGATNVVMRWSFGSMIFYRIGVLWFFKEQPWFDLSFVWIVLSLDLFTQALVFSWVHFRGKWLDARV